MKRIIKKSMAICMIVIMMISMLPVMQTKAATLVLRGAQGVTDLGQASITENGSSGFHGRGVIRKMLAEGATDSGQATITDKL